MTIRFEIVGGAGPMETAAIMAAIIRIAEEQDWARAFPPARPEQGRWVLSGRPRPVTNPFAHGPSPSAEGWAVAPLSAAKRVWRIA